MFKLLAKNEDKQIFEVTYSRTENYEGNFYQIWNTQLVCGIDYINPDTSDTQGYVKADRFIKEVQGDTLVVYWNESIKELLENDGYKIIEKLPTIY